jgi:peptide/nickel transport system ATP-binding protein
MEITEKFDMSLIVISHDLALVAQYCKKILIMYAGRIVENASSLQLFERPLHPYTLGLLQSVPNLKAERTVLKSIPGSPPSLTGPRNGCSFVERCQYSVQKCAIDDPPLAEVEKDRYSACFEWTRLAQGRQ